MLGAVLPLVSIVSCLSISAVPGQGLIQEVITPCGRTGIAVETRLTSAKIRIAVVRVSSVLERAQRWGIERAIEGSICSRCQAPPDILVVF